MWKILVIIDLWKEQKWSNPRYPKYHGWSTIFSSKLYKWIKEKG